MKILVQGTSAAEGWPGVFCACEFCRRARKLGGKDIRTRSGLLIDEDLKVDLGPDTLAQMHRDGSRLDKMCHLLVTHTHDDHFRPHDLVYRTDVFAHWPDGVIPELHIYGNEAVDPSLRRDLGEKYELCKVVFHELQPGETVSLGWKTATALRANHTKSETALNFLIADGAQVHLHASDTGWYPEDTWACLQGVRLSSVTMECTCGAIQQIIEGHLGIAELLKMRDRLGELGCLTDETQFIATHFSHNTGLTHAEYESRLNPHGIQTAYDGMVIEPPVES